MELKNKSNFKIKADGVTYQLYVVNSFELSGSNSIVVNESATGNSGVVYNTGRKQETVPVNGVLLGTDKQDIMDKVANLFRIKDNGIVIDFITPYGNGIRTNEYYIESINFNFNAGVTDQIPFTISLSENRDANVKTTQVNLVQNDIAAFYESTYNTLVGNV